MQDYNPNDMRAALVQESDGSFVKAWDEVTNSYKVSEQCVFMAQKVTVSGTNTYIAIAPIGSLQASAVWQARKVATSSGDTVTTWAGGGAYNQVATDLTALTYA